MASRTWVTLRCVALAACAWGPTAQGAAASVRVVEAFEGASGKHWQRAAGAAVGQGAGATDIIFKGWGGLSLQVEGVPAEADGIAFWVRSDDGRPAALTFGLFEWKGIKQVEAFGKRFWATPTWQRYVFPLATLDRIWAGGGDKKLDRGAVRTLQFQRLIWPRGLASDRLLFDHVEFVKGAERPAVVRKAGPLVLTVDAGKTLGPVRRFWRAISVADTVEQNTDFAGPEGEAMRIIGRDRTFDYARIAWHANRNASSWVKYRYGKPIYTEDAGGKPVYQFADQDKLIDNVRACGLRPMVLLHTLPRELASEPPRDERKGCCCPPKDYAQWHALVKAFVQHYADKYGVDEVSRWYWEVWNEPDLWWHNWKAKGKHAGYDAYFELYDHAAAAIRSVVPQAKVGGPAIAGWPRDYCRKLLVHAIAGPNHVTGKAGSPLAFLSYHCYDGTFGQMLKLYEAKAILDKHAKGRAVEVHATEYGSAIWGRDVAGRHQAAALCQMIDACRHAERHDGARMGWLHWFGTMRSFSATNDAFFAPPSPKGRQQITTLFLHVKGTVLPKPVYNAYRALNHLDGRWLAVSGSALGDPVRALASASDDATRLAVFVYRHDWLDRASAAPSTPVTVTIEHLPFRGGATLREFRIDASQGDVYASWRAAGSPAYGDIGPEQVQAIRAQGIFKAAGPARTLSLEHGGSWITQLTLDPHAIALLVLTAAE